MSVSQRTVSFSIDAGNKVSVEYLAEVLKHLQNILYSIGDHLEGNEPRSKGDFPQSVKDHCTLVISGLNTGSVHAQMQIGDIQESLPEMQTLGEKAISVSDDLLRLLSRENILDMNTINSELINIINNSHRLNRILREYDAIWPEDISNKVSFQFGKSSSISLDPSRKDLIRYILRKSPVEYEKEIEGRLIELRVDKKREFQIDSPEGLITCQYTPEIESIITGSIGELVRIRGLMKPKGGKFVLHINDENSLDSLKQINIKSFRIGKVEKHLKETISVSVVFENDQYIVSNDEMGLLVAAQSMKIAYGEIQEELAILWSEYVNVDENELTDGAKHFRKKLIDLAGQDK